MPQRGTRRIDVTAAFWSASLLSYSIEKDAKDFAFKLKDPSHNNIGPGDLLAWMSSVYYQRDSMDPEHAASLHLVRRKQSVDRHRYG
jgi:hypothetical protein